HRFFENPSDVPYSGYVEPAYIVTPQAVKAGDAQKFGRPHDRLWRIGRERYFEGAGLPAWGLGRLGGGWDDAGGDGENTWRWMKKTSLTLLPAAGARGRLSLQLYVPIDALATPPSIDVVFNGVLVERFVATKSEIRKTWIVDSRRGAANELSITT